MYFIIPTIIVAIVSFIGGIYFEKTNSIKKVKPLKASFNELNKGRTLVVDRTKK